MQCHLNLDPICPVAILPTDSPHHPPLDRHLSVWNGTNTLHPVAHTLLSIVAINVFITLVLHHKVIYCPNQAKKS